jgi:hypothetical protein
MLLSQQEDRAGKRGDSSEYRRRVFDLIASDRGVADVPRDLGIGIRRSTPGGVRNEWSSRGLQEPVFVGLLAVDIPTATVLDSLSASGI